MVLPFDPANPDTEPFTEDEFGEGFAAGWIADLLRGALVLVATLMLALLGVVLVAAGILGVFGVGPGDLVKGPAGVAVKVAGG